MPVLGLIPEDETVREFDARALNFLEIPSCPAWEGIRISIMESCFLL